MKQGETHLISLKGVLKNRLRELILDAGVTQKAIDKHEIFIALSDPWEKSDLEKIAEKIKEKARKELYGE